MKYKNISNKLKNFKVDGEWLDVKPGEFVDLPRLVRLQDPEMELVGESDKPLEKIEEKPVKEPEEVDELKFFSKEELFKMNKAEQVELLKCYGLRRKDIPSLEEGRVEKILELQAE